MLGDIIMARPLMTSDETKRRYVYAVLSGAMTRREAYLYFVDPSSDNPTRAAAQLHTTKQMKQVLSEAGREIESAQSIRRASISMAEKQLEIVRGLLATCGDKTEQEKLAILRSTKPVQDNALAVLSRLCQSHDVTDTDRELAAKQRKDMRNHDVLKQIVR
jgi:hypothetical protein